MDSTSVIISNLKTTINRGGDLKTISILEKKLNSIEKNNGYVKK
tara:strand:+ start:1341 stop:1472 length:132 start_codon:yes stop_codon:yes gene_type:complete